MLKEVKVSVVIPTHDRPELLKRAVQSVISQTYDNLEIIVVDDGMKEKAQVVVESLGDPRVTYLSHPEERGGAAARNTGIAHCSGELIAFLDDDDEWLPQKLEVQVGRLYSASSSVAYCFSAVENLFDDRVEQTSNKVPDGEGYYFERALRRFSGFLTVTLLVKRKALEEVGCFDESLPSHQEIDLILRLAKRFKGIAINTPLVRVNMTRHESIGSKLSRKILGREMVLKKYFEEFKKRPAILAEHYFQIGLWYRDDGDMDKALKYFKKALATKLKSKFVYHFLFTQIFKKNTAKKIGLRFKGLWGASETMGQRVARGGIILFIERFLTRGLQFIRTIIIARLLFPNDIGLFALASLSLAAVSIFVQLGLNSAIIQEKGDVSKYLDNAWTASVIRGVFLAVVMFVAAPWFGEFFNNDSVVPLIRVLGLMAIVEGFENVGMVLLQKELAMNKQFLYNVLGSVIEIVVVIISALTFENVWALVLGTLVGRMAYMVLSYVYHPYRPKFDFNFSGSLHLFKFGRWVALGGIVSFFSIKGDSLVIGKLLASQELAFYQMAFALGTLPAIEFAKTSGNLLFPMYSKLQANKIMMRESFAKVLRLVMLLIMPASIGMFVLAPEIITYVYGSRWLPMLPVFYVVLFIGILKSFEYLVAPVLSGIGKPYVSTVTMAVQSVVMFSLVFPLTENYGTPGTALAVLIGVIVAQVVYMVKLYLEVGFSFLSVIRESLLPLAGSIVMGVAIYQLKESIYVNSHLLLIIFVGIGVFVYFIFIATLDMIFGNRLKNTFLWLRQNI